MRFFFPTPLFCFRCFPILDGGGFFSAEIFLGFSDYLLQECEIFFLHVLWTFFRVCGLTGNRGILFCGGHLLEWEPSAAPRGSARRTLRGDVGVAGGAQSGSASENQGWVPSPARRFSAKFLCMRFFFAACGFCGGFFFEACQKFFEFLFSVLCMCGFFFELCDSNDYFYDSNESF